MNNLSEYAWCFTVEDWLIIHSKDVNSNDEINEENKRAISNCHIYMINTRPQIYFVENSISYNEEKMILQGKIRVSYPNGKSKESAFLRDFMFVEDAVRIKCLYPYKEITIYDCNDKIIRYIPVYSLLQEIDDSELINSLSNLKIEYIGQSYGNGNRNALERLKNHSTFQKILTKLQYERPDLEVFISMMSFQAPILLTNIDGRKNIKFNKEKENKRLRDIIKKPLKPKESINLIEAGLIRYFKPDFNEKLKDSFPSVKQKMLSNLSNLDISGLIIKIPDSELGFRLYTNFVPPHFMHSAKYDLSTDNERCGFFNGSLNLCNPKELIRMKDNK